MLPIVVIGTRRNGKDWTQHLLVTTKNLSAANSTTQNQRQISKPKPSMQTDANSNTAVRPMPAAMSLRRHQHLEPRNRVKRTMPNRRKMARFLSLHRKRPLWIPVAGRPRVKARSHPPVSMVFLRKIPKASFAQKQSQKSLATKMPYSRTLKKYNPSPQACLAKNETRNPIHLTMKTTTDT